MNKIKSKIFGVLRFLAYVFLIVIILGIGGFWGFQIGQRNYFPDISGVKNKETALNETVDFSMFWKVWGQLQENYVDKSKIDSQKMMYGAISGMVKSLEDPYTVFLDPKFSKQFSENVNGSFEGIGAEIGIKKGILTIIAPLKGTPAEKSGLRSGDQVLKVDDKPTSDMTIDDAISVIRGPKGTEVVLTINREGWDGVKEIKIIRETIVIPVLEWEKKEGEIFYLRLYHFSLNSPSEFRKAAMEILDSKEAQKSKKLIFDLRNNPGGYLNAAQEIASWFIERGELIVSEDFGNGEKIDYSSKGYNRFGDWNVILLVDNGSASASEIVAGSLRDQKGAKLVGTKTFGKGSVQELVNLSDGSALKITVARWLTPKGVNISEKGIEPDFEVEFTKEDYDNKTDPQLEKAIELLK